MLQLVVSNHKLSALKGRGLRVTLGHAELKGPEQKLLRFRFGLTQILGVVRNRGIKSSNLSGQALLRDDGPRRRGR